MKQFLLLFLISSFISAGLIAQESKDSSVAPVWPKDTVLYNPERAASFPGGQSAWVSFMIRHVIYPQSAMVNQIQGNVAVEFIVEKDGKVKHIHAVTGPPALRDAAEEVIRQSPKWIPATQDGVTVRSYQRQQIVYKVN